MGVVTLFGKARSGRNEWIFQRVSNLSIVLWGGIFIAQLYLLKEADHANFLTIFTPLWFKLYTSITLLIISLNSVLAGWQIGTDYVKVPSINRIFITLCISVSAIYAVAGLFIVWYL